MAFEMLGETTPLITRWKLDAKDFLGGVRLIKSAMAQTERYMYTQESLARRMGNTISNSYNKIGRSVSEAAADTKKFGGVATSSTQRYIKALERLRAVNARVAKNVGRVWWERFGQVALGFTIAYRAMNAFERGLKSVVSLIGEAIKESGELASVQAKMAMWTTMRAKGVIDYGEAFQKASGNVNALMEASLRSISTFDELATGVDELSQMLGAVPVEMMDKTASLVDFTVMVAQTTGSTTRQVRQEMQSLMQGQIRTTDILIRTMVHMGVLTRQEVSDLKALKGHVAVFEKVAEAVDKVWQKAVERILRSNVVVALEYWQKAMRLVIIQATQLASLLEGKAGENLFAVTFYENAKKFREEITNLDMSRLVVMMTTMNNILDVTLKAAGNVILAFGSIATVIRNLIRTYQELDDTIKKFAGWYLLLLMSRQIIWAFTKLASLFLWVASPIKSLLTLLWLIPKALTVGVLGMAAFSSKAASLARALFTFKVSADAASMSILTYGAAASVISKTVLATFLTKIKAIGRAFLVIAVSAGKAVAKILVITGTILASAAAAVFLAKTVEQVYETLSDMWQPRLEPLGENESKYGLEEHYPDETKKPRGRIVQESFSEAWKRRLEENDKELKDFFTKWLAEKPMEMLDSILGVVGKGSKKFSDFMSDLFDPSKLAIDAEAIETMRQALEGLGYSKEHQESQENLAKYKNILAGLGDEVLVLTKTLEYLDNLGRIATKEDIETARVFAERLVEQGKMPANMIPEYIALTAAKDKLNDKIQVYIDLYKLRNSLMKEGLKLLNDVENTELDVQDKLYEMTHSRYEYELYILDNLYQTNKRNYEAVGKSTENLTALYKISLANLKAEFSVWGNNVVDASKEIAEGMSSAFSDFFFDLFHDDLKSLSDYLGMFLDATSRALSDLMGEMIKFAITGKQTGGGTYGGSFSGGILSGLFNSIAGAVIPGFLGIGSGGGGSSMNLAPSYSGYSASDYGFDVSSSLSAYAPKSYHLGNVNSSGVIPKLHDGLMSDEYLAILQRGERVYPKGDHPIDRVVINNYSSSNVEPKKVKNSSGGTDIQVMISNGMASDIKSRGSGSYSLEQKYGLTPVLNRR